MTERDALLDVFLSGAKKEVFHSVEHRHQIWREDRFDVRSVHAPARTQFQRLLAQATTPPGLDSGRILLLLGESGSGKTHLLRSFRNYVHADGLGFIGYMQMTTATASYGRYLVSNLIDSLDQPYYESLGTTSGLLRLSNAIAARCGDHAAIESLCEDADLGPEDMIEHVYRAADRLIAEPRYADLDLDLVRALLFLQRQDPALKKRVIKYLRGEDLAERDARLLGGMCSRRGEDDARRLVEHLGRLMWAFNSHSLVLCIDQFEDVYQVEDAETAFRRLMASLCAVADQVPSSIIVIACLEDYYKKLRPRLTQSTLDRIESDPPPVRLVSERSTGDVKNIIQQRLGYLYETSGVKPPEEPAEAESRPTSTNGSVDPIYPIPHALVERLAGLRIRSVLDECRQFREACIEAGRIVALPPQPLPVPPEPTLLDQQRIKATKEKIEQEWNDYLAQAQAEPPDSDEELAELFAWAIRTCAHELESGHRFDVCVRGELIDVRILVPVRERKVCLGENVLVALCNARPQGNALRVQIEAAYRRAEGRPLALVRCGEFPSNPRTIIAKTIAELLSKGVRKVVVEESDWRTIAAFQRFRAAHEKRERFMDWLMEENHLSRLLPLIHTLDLDNLDRLKSGTSPRPAAAPPEAPSPRPSPLRDPVPQAPRASAPRTSTPERNAPERSAPRDPERNAPERNAPERGAPERGAPELSASEHSAPRHPPEPSASTDPSPLVLGTTEELMAREILLDPEVLTAHAAFLGSTGSGKTTLALNVIEQLLLRGIPAILVDRKGDLCAYAREAPWSRSHPDPTLDERRRALAERLDIAVFTPGHTEGRQLALSLVPSGLAALKDLDRDQAAGFAAQALGDMLGYKHTRKDKALRAILAQAFQIFVAHVDPDRLDLDSLITFIGDEDPALVAALGRLDTRLFKDLAHDLQVLKLDSADLLSPGAEKLDADLLLGLGTHACPGRTRLSIISTKFLGDSTRVLFWVSQLLLALTRRVTRHPSPHLQAIVLFDEADAYLPAQSQPATKAPMENLLRRARSGGLGLLLATQSPGDLDYKCRDNIRSWFVGRVTQAVALDKMKPLFSDTRVNVSARIPGQSVGEFHLLQDGHATALKGGQSLLCAEQVPEDEILKLAASRRRMPVR